MTFCPFCPPEPDRIFYQGHLVLALWDRYPVTPGHCLLIPRRHIPTWWDATHEERAELLGSTDEVRHIIEQLHHPAGYNLGINSGEAAGQTVPHLHLHLIPRYHGDVPDPRGGVRGVIPSRANYLDRRLEGAPHQKALVQGDQDHLYPHLRQALEKAIRVDLAVAFVQRSGLNLVEPHLRDILRRGGRVRMLTGDYLDVTDPDALEDLLHLSHEMQGLETRVFEVRGNTFHPKCYLLHQADGTSLAFVGSSNLSAPALRNGIEWNYRALDPEGVAQVQQAFETIFEHPATRPLDSDWIHHYRLRRAPMRVAEALPIRAELDPPEPPPKPHGVQQEALAALARTRDEGNRAGLVVMATGLGKTWLAAFDTEAFPRVLFVAHREEILAQALRTFRQVRPQARCGFYKGDDRDIEADLLFASIQTLGRQAHLERFPRDRFDYIVVDEFHHASARTYRQLLDHFEPSFMLGLTATPERTDGGDLLALCGENLVYRCDLVDGIARELLCPFRYFGVPDEVDYSNIPWRNNRFDPEELTAAVATQARAQNALEQHRTRAGQRTVAFCCSVRHAQFMRDYFADAGLRVAAVHSGSDSDPRAASLEKLAAGELDVVFTVDMFNEGMDLPQIDTVMMLRPTESRILWLQQFGRGLRKAEGKERLSVIDYIGNHRAFLLKPQTLFNLPQGDAHIARALNLIQAGTAALPPGCEVTYDLEAVEILQKLLRLRSGQDALLLWYQDFRDRQGERPRAVEAFHEGYNPRSVRARYGSWFGLVRDQGDLTPEEGEALQSAAKFLSELETTGMVKSYKMVLLQALLEEAVFPGEVGLDQLTQAFARVAGRSAKLVRDLSVPVQDLDAMRALLLKNPINAWTSSAGDYFTYEAGVFRSRVAAPGAGLAALKEMTRELVEWRLAEYLSRASDQRGWILKVNQASGRPIIFPLSRKRNLGLPEGPTDVEADGETWTFRFAKEAVNVAERSGESGNQLPVLLRTWFGPDAGQPGTQHRVRLEVENGRYRCSPASEES